MIDKCYRCDEVISMCPCDESTYTADDEISRLRAELAECKRDAELWRAYQARKQAVIDAGMASNPMRAVAANMCPFCHSMIGAPHELWCRHSALAAKGE